MVTAAFPLKLLVLSLNYAPEPVGIGPYSTGLAEWFAARGHSVEVVAGDAYYPQWRRYPNQPANGIRHVVNDVGVVRCRHYIPAKVTTFRRIAHLASFSLTSLLPAIRMARRLRPDVVFVVAPSLLSVPVAWLAARLSHARLWVHIQDFEVEAAFATGMLGHAGLGARMALWVENRILALGDHVSSISPQMVNRLQLKCIDPSRTCELRNWANDAFAPDPQEAKQYRAEWGLGNRKVALYSGNIAHKQGIEIIIEAARILRGRDDLVFIICGNGPSREKLASLSADLPSVQLHDLQPAERMGGLLSLATVHLLPQIPGAADLVLPSKLTNMLISGRPVVATAAAGTGLANEVDGCGLVTPPGDAAAFAAAIARLLDEPAQRAALGRSAAAGARERWYRDAILGRLEAELTKFRATGRAR